MHNVYQIAGRAAGMLMIGVLFLIIHGCDEPLVKAVATVDCAKGTGSSVVTPGGGFKGCLPVEISAQTSHDGLTCEPGAGSNICDSEGSTCMRPGMGFECDTMQVMGDKCACVCTPNPT